MNIILIGYYGGNFGDLLMLRVLVEYFKNIGATISVFTYGDTNLLRGFFGDHDDADVAIFGFKSANDRKVFSEKVKNTKLVLWGGGTCFMDEGGTGGIKHMLTAKLQGAATGYIGIGIDSHKKIKTKLSLFLMAFLSSKIIVRDEESRKIAERFDLLNRHVPVMVMPDIAFGYSKEVITNRLVDDQYIVLCLRDLSEYKKLAGSKCFDGLIKLTLGLVKQFDLNNVRIIVGDVEIDELISDRAVEVLTGEGIVCKKIAGTDVEDVISTIACSKFVLSVRLHPAVISQIFRVPYALFNYSDKNKKYVLSVDAIRRLIEPGLIESYAPDISRPPAGNSAEFAGQVSEALANFKVFLD